MLISILSFLFVLIVTGMWIIFLFRGNDEFIDTTRVHSVIMSLGTTNGLSVGAILTTLTDYHFFISSLLGFALGYIIGKPFSLFAIADGMVSVVMGSIMGVMIPMTIHLNPVWTVLFMDVIFIILMLFNLKLALFIRGNRRTGETGKIIRSEDKTFHHG